MWLVTLVWPPEHLYQTQFATQAYPPPPSQLGGNYKTFICTSQWALWLPMYFLGPQMPSPGVGSSSMEEMGFGTHRCCQIHLLPLPLCSNSSTLFTQFHLKPPHPHQPSFPIGDLPGRAHMVGSETNVLLTRRDFWTAPSTIGYSGCCFGTAASVWGRDG